MENIIKGIAEGMSISQIAKKENEDIKNIERKIELLIRSGFITEEKWGDCNMNCSGCKKICSDNKPFIYQLTEKAIRSLEI